MNQATPEEGGSPRRFETTRWSVVQAAGNATTPEAKQALTQLCESYWRPLYAYVRYRVSTSQEAQDLTQAFFVAFLEKNYAGDADRDRGRFRTFLLTALRNFLSKEWEKARAIKRGGDQIILSLDFQQAESSVSIEPAAGLTAEQHYDQQWAIALLDQVMWRLEQETPASDRFQTLKLFLISDSPGTNYETVAAELDMTEPAVRKAVSRLRQRYRQLLRIEILETVAGPDEVEDEIRKLFSTLQL